MQRFKCIKCIFHLLVIHNQTLWFAKPPFKVCVVDKNRKELWTVASLKDNIYQRI